MTMSLRGRAGWLAPVCLLLSLGVPANRAAGRSLAAPHQTSVQARAAAAPRDRPASRPDSITSITETIAGISLSPVAGPAGVAITIVGTAPVTLTSTVVSVSFVDGAGFVTPLGTTTSVTPTGAYTFNATLPLSLPPGFGYVNVTDGTAPPVALPFYVNAPSVSLSPPSAPRCAPITLTVDNVRPGAELTPTLMYQASGTPVTQALTPITADANGGPATTTFTLPAATDYGSWATVSLAANYSVVLPLAQATISPPTLSVTPAYVVPGATQTLSLSSLPGAFNIVPGSTITFAIGLLGQAPSTIVPTSIVTSSASGTFTATLQFTPPVTGTYVITASDAGLCNQGTSAVEATTTVGSWAPVGSLNDARHSQTATLLPNGEVLVAGGENNPLGPLATAELYDPHTGTFTDTGSMTTARYDQAAALLPSGQVLVAGGTTLPCRPAGDPGCDFVAITSTELYNPDTGVWVPTSSMGVARSAATATLLPDGKVLVAGGCAAFGAAVASAELYDPGTGTWSPTGSMTYARCYHTATLLQDGRVLVAGGDDGRGDSLASAELYDPSTGLWSLANSMSTAREGFTATLLPDGQVLAAGGEDNLTLSQPSAELFDPGTGTWSPTGSMNNARAFHTATLLPNGLVLVTGGCGTSYCDKTLSSTELYDPSDGEWVTTGSLTVARSEHTATLLTSGQVLVTGGYDLNITPVDPVLSSAELYSWTVTQPSSQPSSTPSAIPSSTPTSTPSDTPTGTATATPTDTPASTATPSSTPTSTNTAAPSAPPPSNQPPFFPVPPTGPPVPPPPAVPAPTATPTSKPGPATTAPQQPVFITPPQPTVAPAPETAAGAGHPAMPPLAFSLSAPRTVLSGHTFTIRVRTARHARVTITLQVVATSIVSAGKGRHRRRVTHRRVLYHVTARGTADARGRFAPRLRITYRPHRPARARLTVIIRVAHRSAIRSMTVVIEPPRHRKPRHAKPLPMLPAG